MKKLLTLVLCWLLAFSAIAETTFKAKTAASVAGGYVTSLNKVDGSFEDGSTQWSASVGTIVPTASTEFQGNNIGVWSGTGAGTLDLQWTATASNTYEASAQVDVQGEDDVYVCAYVGTTETGCKLIPALSKIQKISVVADSVMSSAFYLRLKHTGSDAFSVKVDDGKIEPFTFPTAALNVQEGYNAVYTSYAPSTVSGLTYKLNFASSATSTLNSLLSYSASTMRFTALKSSRITLAASVACTANVDLGVNRVTGGMQYIKLYTGGAALDGFYRAQGSRSFDIAAGESFEIGTIGDFGTMVSSSNISITASAISENVVQSYAPSDRIGETIYLPQSVAPRGFISAMGSSIGKTSGTYQGDTYFNLYKVLWPLSLNTAGQPYYISAAKGADALTDWNAGKTIAIDESGLFTRAYKSGTSGNVGEKQDDAMQGHRHAEFGPSVAGNATGNNHPVVAGVNNNGTGSSYSSSLAGWYMSANNAYGTGYQVYTGTPSNDGTNGTPRTASETRPVNVAKYVFIRYGNDAPTLLALPNGTETNYSITATGNAAQVITANVTDIPFIATTQNNLVWSGSSFTSPTDSIYQVSASINLSANTGNAFEYYINGSRVGRLYSQATGVSSIFPFSTTIAVPANSTFSIRPTVTATLSNTADHRLQITRVNGKIDKTFVGNLNPDGFNRTTGTTGLIDNFSFSYGTTNATTVCSASPCSYLDQIGNYVTSVTRGGAGNYTVNFSRTYSKLKCSATVTNAATSGAKTPTRVSCESCSSLQFYTEVPQVGTYDTSGTFLCQGQ